LGRRAGLEHAVGQPHMNTLAFQIDLWSARGELPDTLAEVWTRKQEIQYSSRTRAGTDNFKDIERLRRAMQTCSRSFPKPYGTVARRSSGEAGC
jgi:NTE family protein